MCRRVKALISAMVLLVLTVGLTSVTAGKYAPRKQGEKPLTFAILPFLSPIALTKRFAPLRNYLAEKLGKDVVIVTTSSFETFIERTANDEYDFILTAPHFTVMALDSGKYEVKAVYLKMLQAYIVVRNDSMVNSVSDLAGKSIGVPPVKAIMTMAGIQYMENQGVKEQRGAHYKPYKSHNAAMLATVSGEVDAAIASNFQVLNQIKKGQPLRIVGETRTYPGMGLLAAKRLPDKIKDMFQKTLITMTQDDKGKEVLKEIRYPGFRKTNNEEFEPARAFIK